MNVATAADDTVFDVGLHKGEDTAFYLAKGYRVVAFEANPELVAHCKKRFRDAIAQDRLHIIEGAITQEQQDEPITFYKNKTVTAWGTINAGWAQRNRSVGADSEAIKIERVNIADAFRDYGMPHYLKVDIEGADSVVLGVLRQFANRPRYLSIESEKVDFGALERELTLLVNLGYRRFRPVQQRFIAGSKVTVRSVSGAPLDYVFEKEASGAFGNDLDIPWLSCEECRQQYKHIFRRYRLFGERALIRRIKGVGRCLHAVENIAHVALPGWYDTHASP